MEKTSSLTRVAEFSSSNLESLKKLPRISDYDLPSFRQRISEMDNNGAAEKTSRVHGACDADANANGHVIDYDDYEALPESSTLTTHLIAGALAGMAEHCVMYPVDSVKTRMQSMKPAPNAIYKNVFNGLTTIIRNEGANGTVRGINAVALGAGPAHALYFACYEKMKKVLSSRPGKNPLANAIAGSLATVIHDAAMNPVEVIKQRMQMYNSPYKNVTDCLRSVWKTEGTTAFYRSYTTQLTMNIPFQTVHFVTYELGQEYMNPDRKYNPKTHVVSGAAAGAIAAAVTTPLDVCKTLLNTQERGVTHGRRSINGMLHAFRTIYDLGGLRGYFKGVGARVVFQMPATALSWSVYEFFKYFLTSQWTNA